jgi:YjbE family integral membrane protein
VSFLSSPDFWVALAQIILINIVLSGDNAVVIALASRSLPPHQQKQAIVFGSVGAIVLRVVLTFFAVYLLTLPYLKLIGAALLLWIGIGLLKGDDGEEHLEGHSSIAAAIKTIIVADLVMSLDNVIGVAAAAKGNVPLLVFGLVISIPLIIFGSTLILKLMGRFPVIITLGAGLLGWVAGEMAMSDPAIADWARQQHALHNVVPALGAVLVVAVGKWLMSRQQQPEAAAGQAA